MCQAGSSLPALGLEPAGPCPGGRRTGQSAAQGSSLWVEYEQAWVLGLVRTGPHGGPSGWLLLSVVPGFSSPVRSRPSADTRLFRWELCGFQSFQTFVLPGRTFQSSHWGSLSPPGALYPHPRTSLSPPGALYLHPKAGPCRFSKSLKSLLSQVLCFPKALLKIPPTPTGSLGS